MAAAITMDNSLNIFVVISFSFYRVIREIAVKLTDFEYKVGVAVFIFVNFYLLSLNMGFLEEFKAGSFIRRTKHP
jgi:hypothetical protein